MRRSKVRALLVGVVVCSLPFAAAAETAPVRFDPLSLSLSLHEGLKRRSSGFDALIGPESSVKALLPPGASPQGLASGWMTAALLIDPRENLPRLRRLLSGPDGVPPRVAERELAALEQWIDSAGDCSRERFLVELRRAPWPPVAADDPKDYRDIVASLSRLFDGEPLAQPPEHPESFVYEYPVLSRLVRGARGRWWLTQGASRLEARPLLDAARAIEARGVALSASELRILEGQGPYHPMDADGDAHYPYFRPVFGGIWAIEKGAYARLTAWAERLQTPLVEKLSQQLLSAERRYGPIPSLREKGRSELKATAVQTLGQALEQYRLEARKSVGRLVDELRTGATRIMPYFHIATKDGSFPWQIVVDARDRHIFTRAWTDRITVGVLAERPGLMYERELPRRSGLSSHIAYDPRHHRFLWIGMGVSSRVAELDAGEDGTPPVRLRLDPGWWTEEAEFNPIDGSLVLTEADAVTYRNRRLTVIRPESRTSRSFDLAAGEKTIAMAFDVGTRTFYLARQPGRVEVRRLGLDGSIDEAPFQTLEMPVRGMLRSDPRGLLLSAREGVHGGTGIDVRRLRADGSIEPTVLRSFELEWSKGVSADYDPLTGAIYTGGDKGIAVYTPPLDPSSPETLRLPIRGESGRQAARALADALWNVPQGSQGIASALWALDDRGFSRLLWEEIAALWRADGGLKGVPTSKLWYGDGRERLRERMPTLASALEYPRRLAGLLKMLTFLRLLHPFDGPSLRSPLAPIAAAKAAGVEYPLGELKIVPLSESFRRFIFYVEDRDGLHAVELKTAGQEPGRLLIDVEHFQVSADLWNAHGEDAGTAKPIFFGRYRGEVDLHGRRVSFPNEEADDLGVVLFEYKDGKRFTNVERNEKRRRAREDAVVAAIRLHELGWRGILWEERDGRRVITNTEMHGENVRVLQDGRGELVGDFNVMHKDHRADDDKVRGEETLGLLASFDKRPPNVAVRRRLFDPVLSRLTRGVFDPVERERLAEVVRLELRLDGAK